jgi:membrane protein
VWELLKTTFTEWSEDEAPRLGAALAYYAVFSMAPLLVIIIAIIGLFYRGYSPMQIEQQIGTHVGPQVAGLLAQGIEKSSNLGSGIAATLIGLTVLIIGATGVFVELRAAMNKIFEIRPIDSGNVWGFVRDRASAFAMVLVIAFLLLLSMIASAALSIVMTYFGNILPGAAQIWRALEFGLSFGLITLLFALLFRYVPDTRIPWTDVWIGAAVTSSLFVIGKYLISFYLAHGTLGSTYGAAGALMVLLAWVYYSAQIVFFGAEFTQAYANLYGSRSIPGRRRPAA